MGFTLIKWEFPIHLLRMTVVLPFSDNLKIKGSLHSQNLALLGSAAPASHPGTLRWELNPHPPSKKLLEIFTNLVQF